MLVDLTPEERDFLTSALYEFDDILDAREDVDGLEFSSNLYQKLQNLREEG